LPKYLEKQAFLASVANRADAAATKEKMSEELVI
jgi:hypothetical protein